MSAEHDDLSWLTARPIAHRGLHDGKRPENSMAAFRAALDVSYAIECDLQPSADGVPMVFHDHDLRRMTGQPYKIRERPAAELSALRLGGGDEPIPTLAELLDLTGGAVPLVLELKTQFGRDDGFTDAVAAALRTYPGPVALMSFDPRLTAALSLSAPERPRGLVAEGRWTSGGGFLVTVLRQRFQFISYSISDLPTPAPLAACRLLAMPLICWTVRTGAQQRRAARWADQITFEGFMP